MKIANRYIGESEIPFMIAEAGINHNGDINIAFKMIEVAKSIGFEAIKFQTFRANEFNADDKATYTYQSQGKTITESMMKMFQRYEFSKDQWYRIKKKCDDEKILFLSTPQNYSDLKLLLDIGIPAIKVGSDDFTNIPLLDQYSKVELPLILSCGMADLAEVYTSLETVGFFDKKEVALLLCTSQYPTPASDVNLLKLKTLKAAFKNITVGFSDHTQGSLAASVATGFGASIFEKHFTLDNQLEGPDHWFSENPSGLREWYNSIILAWKMLGSEYVRPTEKEKEMRLLARRSIVVKNPIVKGQVFDENNVGLYRPGSGLPAKFFGEVIGNRAKRDLEKGTMISWGDIL